MKNVKKLKVNPAFKQRQILPLLAVGSGRPAAGGTAGDTPKGAPNPSVVSAVATWVTTE